MDSDQEYYQTSLEISAKDRDGLALDVAMALSTAEGEGQQPLRPQPCLTATPRSTWCCPSRTKSELASVINKLSQVQGVFLVKRAGG